MDKARFLYPFHLIFRPFDGYWELKYDGRGNLRIAGIILLLVYISMVIHAQYTGFVVNYTNPNAFSSLVQLRNLFLPYFLWCLANWSLTTLMDGEGKFSEICMVTAYATFPIALVFLPNAIFSQVVTQEESIFFYFFNTAALIWALFLLFVGTMTVHQYTATKTLVTMFLTVICMGFLMFLGMLFFSLIQQMYSFVYTIYQEILFRY